MNYSRQDLSYKSQNFEKGTAEIVINGQVVVCNMFTDDDGDIGFYLDNKEYYFKDIKHI